MMSSRIARSALAGLVITASAGLVAADPVTPGSSGVRLVVIGEGAFGSDSFRMTGLNLVHGSGDGGAQFDSSLDGLQWSCDGDDCNTRSASYAGIEDWSVVQTVRACGEADCAFSSDIRLQGTE
ncbi:hypothetical protein SAMN05421763_1175 [[Luteovulum] sphaeroides subsp. megalophilum]|uniref:hypothetical protein n=1 Tax=Cereibacter sphaeroides TaxID=1063 RepID=UPI0002A22196|nr:hypothetical protein [Cereibacter sphaeroides]EKX56454.1 hypothetical protein D516_2966 [Rhodobacter sp. AKP1]SNT42054.1 hypothetical protein SAMN05421763_1175 [[Luteovulum] sphaeroides subsp. megalophilum]